MTENSFENDYYLKIGLLLKELRLKKGITISELADGICSISHISRIESGKRCPSSIILRQLTNRLGVTPNFLFRAIESPYALFVNELLEELFSYIDRDDFHNVFNIIKENEKNMDIESLEKNSILDYQIIRGLTCISETMITKRYDWGINELTKYLNLTYKETCNPTDVELAFMFHIGQFLLLNNQVEEGYEYLKKLENCSDIIRFFVTPCIYPKYFAYLVVGCIDVGKFDEAIEYIEHGIKDCKMRNTQYLLREYYFLKGETYYHLGDKEQFEYWTNEAISLNRMIKYTDTEYFNYFYKERLEKLNIQI